MGLEKKKEKTQLKRLGLEFEFEVSERNSLKYSISSPQDQDSGVGGNI